MFQAMGTMLVKIDLARDYSAHPFGRYRRHGPVSGERFREEKLEPLLREGADLVIDLDGVSALSSSFLDEAFAGLIRRGVLTAQQFITRVRLISKRDPTYIDDIVGYVNEAAA